MNQAAKWAGWGVRFVGSVSGWLTIAGLIFVCLLIVATVGLCIYALVVGP